MDLRTRINRHIENNHSVPQDLQILDWDGKIQMEAYLDAIGIDKDKFFALDYDRQIKAIRALKEKLEGDAKRFTSFDLGEVLKKVEAALDYMLPSKPVETV